jgi:hydroxymethylglutaryl-CoA lyase
VAESLRDFREIAAQRPEGMQIRGYVSTAFRCPYSGDIEPGAVRKVVDELMEIGCDEVSIGDTIGTASPGQTKALARELANVPNLFWHFHDTYGRAVANVMIALESGVGVGFDASAGGLGGCPYAPGATGNLATEDLVCLLESEGVGTGVNAELLARASLEVLALLDRLPSAKSQRALLAQP